MHFIQSAKLGLNKDQVVVVKNAGLLSRTGQGRFSKFGIATSGSQKIAAVRWSSWWTKLDKWNEVERVTEFATDEFSFR